MIRASIAQTEPSLLLLLTLGANVETVDINVQNGRKVSDCQIAGDDKNDRFISVIYQVN
jgi:hypothetical protein